MSCVWVLCRALEVLDLLADMRRTELTTRLGISAQEIARWDDISRRMFVPFHDDGIISQFEGYEKLREFDWDGYRTRYLNIQRLDLILEGENDSANRYKVSKQADVLMLFYLFSAEELGELFKRLGYPFEYETIPRNVDYYVGRTTHGSTLCRVVTAWVLARSDRTRSTQFFMRRCKAMWPTSSRAPRPKAFTSVRWRERSIWCNGCGPASRSRTMFCGSIRSCRRTSFASTCACAIAGIHSTCG